MPAIAEIENDVASKKNTPGRAGRPFVLYIPSDIDAGLEKFRDAHEFPPSLTSSINHILREYLRENGLLPKSKGQRASQPPD